MNYQVYIPKKASTLSHRLTLALVYSGVAIRVVYSGTGVQFTMLIKCVL